MFAKSVKYARLAIPDRPEQTYQGAFCGLLIAALDYEIATGEVGESNSRSSLCDVLTMIVQATAEFLALFKRRPRVLEPRVGFSNVDGMLGPLDRRV